MNRILNEIIPGYEIPILQTRNIYDIFRIESFGELHDISEGGLSQVINYINLIAKIHISILAGGQNDQT